VGLLVLAAAVFVAGALTPAAQSPGGLALPTTEPPTRPLSGAAPGQPTARPTAFPTPAANTPPAAAAAQPNPQPTRSPTPEPTEPPTRPPAAGSPVDTIRQHYAFINARRYAEGYALMDAQLRRLNSPAEYAGWFTNKVSIEATSIDLVSQTEGEAVVRSVVLTTDRVNGEAVTSRVSEQFVLHTENGMWRINRVAASDNP
jgi:hypothetical protein